MDKKQADKIAKEAKDLLVCSSCPAVLECDNIDGPCYKKTLKHRVKNSA